MKKILFFAAVAAVALTGCSKEDANNGSAASGNEISMRAVLEKTTNGRASAMTTQRFSSFFVYAYKDNFQSGGSPYLQTGVFKLDNQTNSPWSYGAKAYYPTEGSLKFYAYSPIADQNMAAEGLRYEQLYSGIYEAYFNYTVPANQSGLPEDPDQNPEFEGISLAEDLLVAKNETVTHDVSFTFEHALSAATFSAVNKNAKNSGLVYVIKKIEITNLYNEGRYEYEGNKWVIENPAQDYFVNYVAPIPPSGVALEPMGDVNVTSLLTPNDFLLILPQNPKDVTPGANLTKWGTTPNNVQDGDTEIYVKLTYTFSGANESYYEDGKDYAERYFAIRTGDLFDDGFEMGKCYDFAFTFSHDFLQEIVMSAKVTEWGWDAEPSEVIPVLPEYQP